MGYRCSLLLFKYIIRWAEWKMLNSGMVNWDKSTVTKMTFQNHQENSDKINLSKNHRMLKQEGISVICKNNLPLLKMRKMKSSSGELGQKSRFLTNNACSLRHNILSWKNSYSLKYLDSKKFGRSKCNSHTIKR